MIRWCILRSIRGVKGDCFGAVDEGTVNLNALMLVRFSSGRSVGDMTTALTRTRFVPAGAGIVTDYWTDKENPWNRIICAVDRHSS
jgi:hypothetical protein